MRFDANIHIKECEGVYGPSDDTFLLLECVEVERGDRVLEMGCGTGIISIHCAMAGASVTAVDLSRRAVECTRENAKANDVDLNLIQSDLFSNVKGKFDLVLFNPPYLPVEEGGELERAWAGGRGGIEVVSRFLHGLPDHLAEGGRALLLVSSKMDLKNLFSQFEWLNGRTLASRKFFFEELSVLELTL